MRLKTKVSKNVSFDEVVLNQPMFEDIEFPNFHLDIKLYDFLYIPTQDLSASFINKLKILAPSKTFHNISGKFIILCDEYYNDF